MSSGELEVLSSTLVTHIRDMTLDTIQNQLSLLGSISNYHWWHYICLDGQASSQSIGVNLHEHFLYHPTCDTDADKHRQKYLPKSPRNWLMYYIINDDIYPASAVAATLKQLIKIDKKKKEETSVFPDENQSITDIVHLPHKKHRRFASHILKLTPDILFKSLDISNSVISNCADRIDHCLMYAANNYSHMASFFGSKIVPCRTQ